VLAREQNVKEIVRRAAIGQDTRPLPRNGASKDDQWAGARGSGVQLDRCYLGID